MADEMPHLKLSAGCRTALALAGPGLDTDAVFRLNPGLRRLYLVGGVRHLPGDDPRIVHIDCPTNDRLEERLGDAFRREPLFFAEGRVGLLFSPEDIRSRAQACAATAQAFKEFTQTVLSSVALHATRGWHMLANTLLNLPRLANERTLDDLRDRGRGWAAVVVGAGPSIDHTVHELRAARERPIVIACDAACGTLARAGMIPDLIVTTDDSERVWRHFARLPKSFRSLPLAVLTHSAWPVIRRHAGPLFAGRPANAAGEAIARFTRLDLPPFDSGQSVGHAALETAVLMGCSPIVLTGFDLGYQGDRFHPADMQLPYFHDHPPLEENLLTVPGNDGHPVKTDLSMFFYLREFERRIARLRTPVINATKGGAVIRGARCLPLERALAEHVSAKPRPDLLGSHPRKVADLDMLRQRLCDDTARFLRDAEQALHIVNENPSTALTDPPFPFLKKHRDLLDLISETENPAQLAGFQFAWEDARRDPRQIPSFQKNARLHLAEMIGYAAMLPLLVRMWDPPHPAGHPTRALILALETNPAWESFLQRMTDSGMELVRYTSDPNDIPAIWAIIQEQRIDRMICLDGAAWPATWGMPGLPCLDFKTRPPDDENVIPEQWLPDYTAVCADESLLQAWRERMPEEQLISDCRLPIAE